MEDKKIIDMAMEVRDFCRSQDNCKECPFYTQNRAKNSCGITELAPSYWFNYNYYSVSELIHMDDPAEVARIMKEQGMSEHDKVQVIVARWERING